MFSFSAQYLDELLSSPGSLDLNTDEGHETDSSSDAQEPISLLKVCRTLSAIETDLGMLAPTLMNLLTSTVEVNRKTNKAGAELLTESNLILLETIREKLLGLLMLHSYTIQKAQFMRNVIQDINQLVIQTPVRYPPRNDSQIFEQNNKVCLGFELLNDGLDFEKAMNLVGNDDDIKSGKAMNLVRNDDVVTSIRKTSCSPNKDQLTRPESSTRRKGSGSAARRKTRKDGPRVERVTKNRRSKHPKKFCCDLDNIEFTTKAGLIGHMHTIHQPEITEKFYCEFPYCRFVSKYKHNVKTHKRKWNHYTDDERKQGIEKYIRKARNPL